MNESEGKDKRWISVRDVLPSENKSVLVAGNFGIAIDKISFPKDGNLWNITCKNSITHWMPLPEPPNGKDET